MERRCPVCEGRPPRRNVAGLCTACIEGWPHASRTSVAGCDETVAVWAYTDEVRPAILAGKRDMRAAIFRALAPYLAEVVRPYLMSDSLLTWVPASPAGRRHRGFDQGRLIAETMARHLGVPARPSLARTGRPQRGLGGQDRRSGPRLRVRTDWTRRGRTEQVILVDDVITTGASLATAAHALRLIQPDLDLIGAALARRD